MSDIGLFKQRLKDLRKKHNITQQDLADQLGVVRTSVTNYEAGRTSPDPETLSLIANILCTSTDYLLGRTDIKEPIDSFVQGDLSGPSDDKQSINIEELSPESQEDLKKYIELLKLKDMQKRNSENCDELSSFE